MKKIDLSNVLAGVRELAAVKQFFNHMQESYIEAIEDLAKGLVASSNDYIVLYGLVNSDVLPSYNISAGAILYQGEVYKVNGFAGVAGGADVAVLTLNVANATLEYTDGSNQNTLTTRTFTISIGAAGSGTVNYSALVTLKAKVKTMLDVAGDISTHNADAAAHAAAFAGYNNGIVSYDTAIKQGVVFCQGGTDPVSGAVSIVQVAVSGANIWQLATITGGAGSTGDMYYRNSSNGGTSWSAWTSINT